MLKPDKWQAIFGNDGRALCFRKALKLIVLGVSSGLHVCSSCQTYGFYAL